MSRISAVLAHSDHQRHVLTPASLQYFLAIIFVHRNHMYEISWCINVAPTFYEVGSLVHFLHTWCIKVRNRVSQFSMTFNGRFLRSRYMPFPLNGMTKEMSICGKSIELVQQHTTHIIWGIINWGRESTLTHLPDDRKKGCSVLQGREGGRS